MDIVTIYKTGIIIHYVFFGILILVNCLIQLIYQAYRWVNDKKWGVGEEVWWRNIFKNVSQAMVSEYQGFWANAFLLCWFALLAGTIWPLFWPVLKAFIILYLLRVGIRFKKKINKAMEKKID